METRATRIGLWAWAILDLRSSSGSRSRSWASTRSTRRTSRAGRSRASRRSGSRRPGTTTRCATRCGCRCAPGLFATAVALVLGSLAAFGLSRARFFGRDSISFLFILPIALPGIITGLALNSFFVIWGVSFSLWTIVIGHATFCVVIVYNNVIARLRRTSGSFFEASADLGATGFQTFRYVTLPVDRHGARRRRPARLRALVGRDRRHVLHRGRAEHAAAAALRLHPAGPEPADRERDRAGRDRRQPDPGRARAAADERSRSGRG